MELESDPVVDRLAALFADHPAWVAAAEQLDRSATSSVWFWHRPGEPFHLEQKAGRTRLCPGAAADPDLVFRFSALAIDRLEGVSGGIGEFAVELFERILDEDPDHAVGFRIAVPFTRLWRRGYVRLLLAAGPQVLRFGATHGIDHVGALRRFVSDLRRKKPAAWENDDS